MLQSLHPHPARRRQWLYIHHPDRSSAPVFPLGPVSASPLALVLPLESEQVSRLEMAFPSVSELDFSFLPLHVLPLLMLLRLRKNSLRAVGGAGDGIDFQCLFFHNILCYLFCPFQECLITSLSVTRIALIVSILNDDCM